MTIDAFTIVSTLQQTSVKYKRIWEFYPRRNPISCIAFSNTMFSYAGISLLAGLFHMSITKTSYNMIQMWYMICLVMLEISSVH